MNSRVLSTDFPFNSPILITNIFLVYFIVSKMSLRLCSLSSFFSFWAPQTDWSQLLFLQGHRFSLLRAQICCWTTVVNLKNFRYCTFHLQSPYLVPFYITLFPLIFFICWNIVLFLQFLSMVSFSSLGRFKMVDLKSLSSSSNAWASSWTVSINFFLPPVNGPYFLVPGMFPNFVLKSGHCECYDVSTLEIRFSLLPGVFCYCLLWVVVCFMIFWTLFVKSVFFVVLTEVCVPLP